MEEWTYGMISGTTPETWPGTVPGTLYMVALVACYYNFEGLF